MRLTSWKDLKRLAEETRDKAGQRPLIRVCGGTGCRARGSLDVLECFVNAVKESGVEATITTKMTGCHGLCERGPLVLIDPPGFFYQGVRPEDVEEIVQKSVKASTVVERLLAHDLLTGEKVKSEKDLPFYKKQQRLALRLNGIVDPTNVADYIAYGGYSSLARVLSEFKPEEVVDEIERSGLRGRGGGGFPTGKKWRICRHQPGDVKYIVCNGDEGDPGAFMDRSIMEGNPHAVLEGMIIGAYAIGAKEGFIYVRNEYPLAVRYLTTAISQAREHGLLGENILGSGFSFDIHIVRGGGAFVCGEETALMASIEGARGEPRPRPPYPVEKGLWGQPTNINNVETWANVPVIIEKGAKWFAELGTEGSKGTKVFALVGKVKNTGLVEVPMGIPLGEVIFDIGGGIPRNRKFKAVQVGGPSGGCVPASLLNLPVDYEGLTGAGSMMGSGGMVVMDENSCMVDVAKYFLSFTKDESCGKCTPCRDGIPKMLDILERITAGEGEMEDLDELENLAVTIKETALCGLGQTAPNPVLTTLRYFRDEYEEHIKHKRCPATACRKIASAPCHHTCPIGQDAASYISLTAQGKFKEAMDVVLETNPLPAICGRVCHHPCEVKCKAGEIGEPIAIRAVKRFLDEKVAPPKAQPVPKQYNERVAIVGSGPAGLTAAWELAKRGYPVTVFEALPVAGGMLAVGIPEYRLPKEILKRDIANNIEALGVEIKTNSPVKDVNDLLNQGYKAVFLAVGAWKNTPLGIKGEQAEGVLDPIDFLKGVNLGENPKIGKRVAVIGGGNTAIDVARVAKRMGADVTIVYRRTRNEMPAISDEVGAALEEGIDIQFLALPTEVIVKNGKVAGLKCVRMELGEFGKDGRRKPIPKEGSEFRLDVDTLVPAIGQKPDLSLVEDKGIEITDWGTLVVDPETCETTKPGVFAGGDAVTGPGTVTEAMSMGKTVAESIHRFLRGISQKREYQVTKPTRQVPPLEISPEEIESSRAKIPHLPVSERVNSFKEAELTLTEEAAVAECKRCLRCDLAEE